MDEHPEQLLVRFRLYTLIGIAVLMTNSVVVAVFLSSREIRKKFILFNFLAVADIVNGVSFIVTGLGRELLLDAGHFFETTTPRECLFEHPWPILLILAGQLPAAVNLMLATERIVAVRCHSWYRRVWSFRCKIYLGLLGCLISLVGLLLAALVVLSPSVADHEWRWRMCTVMESTGSFYGTIHYSLISASYLIAFFILLVCFSFVKQSKTPSKEELRRQHLLFVVTGLAVTMVSFPNLVLIFNEWALISPNELFIGLAYCLYGVESSMNLFVYVVFREDFRHALFRIVGLQTETSMPQPEVTPFARSSRLHFMSLADIEASSDP